ncbi:MAG: T9SS type A sorting domain-containing protein [Bacteroidota bacterium]|nr:T9SS type A sorting domain-containing protein [Bacteroidota bacterium]
MSFTHDDDHGVYIYLANPPTNGTLDFWPYGTVGTENFFNTVDFYQMILVRDNNGLVHVYINGNEFAEYDDSVTQEYIPQPGKNYLKFFRDHPSVLADEASPGFVSNIVISTSAWTPQEVAVKWGAFCESLLATEELNIETIRIFPIPAKNNLTVQFPGFQSRATLSVFDITGKLIIQQDVFKELISIDVSTLHSGLYILKIDRGTTSRMIKFTKN